MRSNILYSGTLTFTVFANETEDRCMMTKKDKISMSVGLIYVPVAKSEK